MIPIPNPIDEQNTADVPAIARLQPLVEVIQSCRHDRNFNSPTLATTSPFEHEKAHKRLNQHIEEVGLWVKKLEDLYAEFPEYPGLQDDLKQLSQITSGPCDQYSHVLRAEQAAIMSTWYHALDIWDLQKLVQEKDSFDHTAVDEGTHAPMEGEGEEVYDESSYNL